MNRTLGVSAFVLGLAVVGWVAAGYIGSNALALTMTLLIAAFYAMGGVELWRFRRATADLGAALDALPERLPALGGWLAGLPPALQNAVRLRVEGERVGLPGPQMAPYLVGLLVLLGMLGTFLGMVVTLNGAVLALETTSDLAAMRAALAAPVKGLGLAFGTSVAGVAASAMLGLVSALCRRERALVGQRLDARVATTLREHSRAHQRERTLETLQAQARAVPEVLDRLDALVAQIERRSAMLDATLTAGQERFHAAAQSAYGALAASVDRSLRESLTEGARAAAAAIQPVAEATMAGIARETATLQERLSGAVAQQLDGIAGRFDTTVGAVAQTWTAALREHERAGAALTTGLGQAIERCTRTVESGTAALIAAAEGRQVALHAELAAAAADLSRQTTALHERVAASAAQQLDAVAVRVADTAASASDAWRVALADQGRSHLALTDGLARALDGFTHTFDARSVTLLDSVDARHAALQTELAATAGRLAQDSIAAQQRAAADVGQRLDGVVERFGATAATVADGWREALDAHARSSGAASAGLDRTLERHARAFEAHGAGLLASVDARHDALRAQLEATVAELAARTGALHERVAATASEQLDGAAGRFGAAAETVARSWQGALAAQQRTSETLADRLHGALAALAATSEAQSAMLLQTVERSHQALQADAAESDRARLAAWTGALDRVAADLQQGWQQAGVQASAQQAAICRTLEATARDIHAQAAEQAGRTIAEMTRLIETASQAPRAAADVVGALREQLSKGMARDNALLDERSRILETLDTLLGAVHRGAHEQRAAIDALVASAASVLEHAGVQFGAQLEAETQKMAEVAVHVAGSAAEVGSMGEAFGAAVQRFGASSESLADQLQRIEAALARSSARSDEQLAYYVAQAREIVDLSISSQRQIIEDLQRLPIRHQPPAAVATA